MGRGDALRIVGQKARRPQVSAVELGALLLEGSGEPAVGTGRPGWGSQREAIMPLMIHREDR